jgi:signal transduction histidine kinase
MWNKLSLRIKITVITVATLTLLCAGLTTAAILNTSVFAPTIHIPYQRFPDENGYNTGDFDKDVEIDTSDEVYKVSRDQFKTISIITALGVIAVGAFLTWFLTGKTLKPLQTFADRVEETDEHKLSGQVALPPSSSEVSRLTNSFNNMLEKLERAFTNKKLFASNAAHELKTPLTNILTNIEVMQMDEKPDIEDYKEVVDITRENVERLTVLIQDLLYFNAELDEDNFESFKTAPFFEKITEDLSAAVYDKNIKIGIKTLKYKSVCLDKNFSVIFKARAICSFTVLFDIFNNFDISLFVSPSIRLSRNTSFRFGGKLSSNSSNNFA